MLQILLPGFVEDTKVYHLKQDRTGQGLKLELHSTYPMASIDDMARSLDERYTVLVDSMHPFIADQLKAHRKGFRVITGRI